MLLLCALVLWRLRASHDDAEPPASAPGAGATPAAGSGSAANGTGDAKTPPPDGAPPAGKWRGLRLLEPGSVPKEAAPPPHPWAAYLEMREATFRRMDETLVSLDVEKVAFADLPGTLGAAGGLVVRIDPACAPGYPTLTIRTHSLNARSTLSLIASYFSLRMAVGVDGVTWLVPREGRAECEPEFMPDLLRWEDALERESRSPEAEKAEGAATLAAMRDKRARVELVEVTLKEALQTLERTFGVPVEDRRSGDPPESERVTIVQESVTLEEALREILAPLEMGTFVDGNKVELHLRSEIEEFAESDKFSAEHEKQKDARKNELLARKVTLNGCPLSAEDLAAETAKQAGFPVVLDPLLRTSSARWEAVEAELTAGEVLRAIEAGAGCKCRLRDSNWPEYGEGDSWKLWVFWKTPAPENPTPR
ncbi:MAG: hypothetical protein HYY18_19175 [Planctomycetes bacterium]|nr:hypothetical protein [Planctomycetota bacterium]